MPVLQLGVLEYSRDELWRKDSDQLGEGDAVTHGLLELDNGRYGLGNGIFNPPSDRLTDGRIASRFRNAHSFASPI